MPSPLYRLIALDIDGTILSVYRQVSDCINEILLECEERGVHIVTATGRSLVSARSFTKNLSAISSVVSFQGALVTEPQTGVAVWRKLMGNEHVKEAMDYLERKDFEVVAYVEDRIVVEHLTHWVKSYSERNGLEVEVGNIRDLERSPYRLLLVGDEDHILAGESDMQSEIGNRLYVTRSLPNFCEILNPEAGKERALSWLCSKNDLTREEVVSFGNGFNDIPMLEWSGLGVAMQDSDPLVIDASDDTAPIADKDGVASYIRMLLDQNLLGVGL